MSAKEKTSTKMQTATVDSHPKYSEMILEAIKDNKVEGKLNVSRQAIMKFVTAKYQLDPVKASRHVNLNLKKMLESGAIKPAAAAGRKGAGSYRLGQASKEKEKKATKGKKATKEKKATKGKKVTKGKKITKEKKATKGKISEMKKATKGKKVTMAGSAKEMMKVKIKGRVAGALKQANKTSSKPKKTSVAPRMKKL